MISAMMRGVRQAGTLFAAPTYLFILASFACSAAIAVSIAIACADNAA